MIVVTPDPSLDDIYPIDGIDWGGLIIACSEAFDVTPNVTQEIKPDESKDIRIFMHDLEDRRMVDIMFEGHIVLDT
jgi:hypothetical protein